MSGPGAGRVVIPPPAQQALQMVLTCGGAGCRHTFEPDPLAFAVGRLSCPRCHGWCFAARLVEPGEAGEGS